MEQKTKMEELAEKLNGIDYAETIKSEDLEFARENNLLIVYGASDDLLIMAGTI